MALEFSSTSGLINRVGLDHQAHMRSMSRVLANAIAKSLNDRTMLVDGRSKARARVSDIRSESTSTGVQYSVVVTQDILPDVKDARRRKIKKVHDALKNKLSSKNGVVDLLGSGGVH